MIMLLLCFLIMGIDASGISIALFLSFVNSLFDPNFKWPDSPIQMNGNGLHFSVTAFSHSVNDTRRNISVKI